MDADKILEIASTAKFGAKTLIRLARTKMPINPSSTGFLGSLTAIMVTIGPVRQTLAAYAVTSMPAEDTCI